MDSRVKSTVTVRTSSWYSRVRALMPQVTAAGTGHYGAGAIYLSRLVATLPRTTDDVVAERAEGDWAEITWAGYADRALRVAAALRDMGVAPGDRVAMLLRNRPEFHYVDTGAMLARAVPISIHNSSPPAQVRHFVRHSRGILRDGDA
jgi:acyl-CoA synthetase (AMP-forming)/AMP-acid ligase II